MSEESLGLVAWWAMDYGLFQKKSKQVRDIKEMTCGNSMGHQLKEWNFQGVHKKLVEFLWVLIFELWNFHQQG